MEIFQEVNDKTSFIKGNLEKFLEEHILKIFGASTQFKIDYNRSLDSKIRIHVKVPRGVLNSLFRGEYTNKKIFEEKKNNIAEPIGKKLEKFGFWPKINIEKFNITKSEFEVVYGIELRLTPERVRINGQGVKWPTQRQS